MDYSLLHGSQGTPPLNALIRKISPDLRSSGVYAAYSEFPEQHSFRVDDVPRSDMHLPATVESIDVQH